MPQRVYADLVSYFKENPDDSAQQVADEVGCSYAYLSLIKWGHREPNLALALRLARRCRVPLESLVVEKKKRQMVG